MCETGIVLIDNLCHLGMRSGGIAFLFAYALMLVVVAAAFLKWKRLVPLISPYRNEMAIAEDRLHRHYDPDDKLSLPVGEVQGMWQAIGYATLGRKILLLAIIFPLLLIAR